VHVIFCDEAHRELAKRAATETRAADGVTADNDGGRERQHNTMVERLTIIPIPFDRNEIRNPLTDMTLPRSTELQNNAQSRQHAPELAHAKHNNNSNKAQDVAFIFHTSGTSSGLPKPIPQTHHGALRVLPLCNQGDGSPPPATFTPTPLYHGGIADTLRAWTAEAAIWLFPGDAAPITVSTLSACVGVARRYELQSNEVQPVTSSGPTIRACGQLKYFSSVPYILSMLADDPTGAGLSLLQSMSLVGVGGAALAPATGARLVAAHVHLVSRYGSAECGFLLTSHREYAIDTAWEFLRLPPRSTTDELIRMEPQDDGSGLSELVVLSGWPHRAKTNRDDGSYATSDLFEPHPSIPNAWKCNSRADATIVLSTGKKFDPAPLEDSIAAELCGTVREVMVVGTRRQSVGLLVFPKFEGKDSGAAACAGTNGSIGVGDQEILGKVWEVVQRMNQKGQQHTRIPRSHIHVMPLDTPPLERSSKGTLLRKPAEQLYQTVIEALYSGAQAIATESEEARIDIRNENLEEYLAGMVSEELGLEAKIRGDQDFFALGVDSVMCARLRGRIGREVLRGHEELPFNVVYDCGNVQR
jgi:hypothetical protein